MHTSTLGLLITGTRLTVCDIVSGQHMFLQCNHTIENFETNGTGCIPAVNLLMLVKRRQVVKHFVAQVALETQCHLQRRGIVT